MTLLQAVLLTKLHSKVQYVLIPSCLVVCHRTREEIFQGCWWGPRLHKQRLYYLSEGTSMVCRLANHQSWADKLG